MRRNGRSDRLPIRPIVVVLGLALALGACVHPNGPLIGEWRGQSPGASLDVPKTVDVTLDGQPGDATGSYYFTAQENDPTLVTGHGERQWGGTWVRTQRVVNGQPLSIYRLKALIGGEIDTYALEPNGTLRPVDPNGLPDMTPAGSLYTLSPVSTRNAR